MTKHDWKVGECGIFCGPYPHMAGLLNFKARVVQTGIARQLLNVQFSDGSIYSVRPDDLIPTSRPTPKDPFAPGEYVTCVEKRADSSTYSKIGVTYLVDKFEHHTDGWFCALGISSYSHEVEPLGHRKRDFRPATPEEIAAYKAKYEVEPVVELNPSVSHNSLAGSSVTFDGKTYILRDPSNRPTIEIAGVVYELENV